jgi:hypothetical protein
VYDEYLYISSFVVGCCCSLPRTYVRTYDASLHIMPRPAATPSATAAAAAAARPAAAGVRWAAPETFEPVQPTSVEAGQVGDAIKDRPGATAGLTVV